MKKLNKLFVLAGILLLLVGCAKKAEVSFATSEVSIAPEGGSVEVVLRSNGSWTVDSYPEWLAVSPTSGNGDATLTLTASANNESERLGEIKVSTKDNAATLKVVQGLRDLYLMVSPYEITCNREGGEYEVTVHTNLDWRLAELPTWLTASVTEGSNDGQIILTVAPISGDSDEGRQATVTVLTDVLTTQIDVIQSVVSSYNFSVSPMELEFDYLGGTSALAVTGNVAWTASTEAEWIAIDLSSGEGNAEVMLNVAESPELTSREAAIRFDYTFPGSTSAFVLVWVRQGPAPDPHFLTVSPTELSFIKDGGTAEINVECDTDWNVEFLSEWASLSATSGTGNATLVLSVEENLVVVPRSFSFMVVSGALSQRVTVSQEQGEEPPMVTLTPDTLYISDVGAVATLNVTSNVSWELQSPDDWVMMLNHSGSGNASMDVIVYENQTTSTRYGEVVALYNGTEMDRTVIVQAGKVVILEVDTTQINARPEGGEYTIHVTSTLNWQVIKGASWLSYTPTSGSGDGEIVVVVEPMTTPAPRTAEIHITGDYNAQVVITVSQSGN